ncbi:MAG: DUF1553 domain-containing protein [Verrucomicrobiae bacterium]|nr:DUF1553 domain-containing protein [Verrucomicrobiae bacterium]
MRVVRKRSLARSLSAFAAGWLMVGSPAFAIEQGSVVDPTLSFRNDVVPVLTKAGCNLGACHGAQTGKGELALSLRGEDPTRDRETLLKSFVNLADPDKSFLLKKAIAAVPHDGGKRFEPDSESYELLRQWIVEGANGQRDGEAQIVRLEVAPETKVIFAPERSLRIQVTAHFSDGTARDVNRWAIYEPSTLNVEVDGVGNVTSFQPGETTVNIRYLGMQAPVRLAFVPERPGFVWSEPKAANFIDDALQAKWKTLRINPSDLCDDATFVRRAYLDLIGMVPGPEEARSFVADPDPGKRAKLVDQLMERPEFADFWALKWADLLRVEEKVLDNRGVAAFHGWIRQSIADNKPVDRFCREILEALGSTYQVAPANYYRALRTADQRAEAVAQIFLGTRLNCAKCHNHPFERWTMDDYYQFAAVFDGIDYDIKENKRYDKNDKNNFVGEQVVKLVEKRELKHPKTGNAPPPRLLGETENLNGDDQRLRAMAEWLTSPDQPLFARVQVNRIWFQLMGRGIVDPVDDFRATNPPVNPELLDALAGDFLASGFDLRHAIRTICASRAYQLDSEPNDTNRDDEINFARSLPRRLGAEVLLDSIYLAMGGKARFEGYDKSMRASQMPGVRAVYRPKAPTHEDTFLHLFGKPPRLTNSDTERANDTSLAQVFELTSGGTLNELLTGPDNQLSKWLKENPENGNLVDQLYWSILTREPSRTERMAYDYFLGQAEDRRKAAEDVAWSLLNAKEFLLRR